MSYPMHLRKRRGVAIVLTVVLLAVFFALAAAFASMTALNARTGANMADLHRARLAADWAVSTTGIAGPTGGSDEKPVGLVHVALAGPEGTTTLRQHISGTRGIIRTRAARAALDMLRMAMIEVG